MAEKTEKTAQIDLENKLTLDDIIDDLRKISAGVSRKYETAHGSQKFLLNTIKQELSRTLRKFEMLQAE